MISANGIGVIIVSDTNLVQGNYIGTDATGTQPLGNDSYGIAIGGANNNIVGGTTAGAGNTIAFDALGGVMVNAVHAPANDNAILRNRIFGHDNGLGIELVGGANNNQAFPTITSAMVDGEVTTITGTLASAADTTYTVELYVNSVCNPSGYGEGERFFASLTVTTDDTGNAAFTLAVPIAVNAGQFLSATATDPAGNTSEFAACVAVTGAGSVGKVSEWGGRVVLNLATPGLSWPFEHEILGVTGTVTQTQAAHVIRVDGSKMAPGDPILASHTTWNGDDLFFGAFGREAFDEAAPAWTDDVVTLDLRPVGEGCGRCV